MSRRSRFAILADHWVMFVRPSESCKMAQELTSSKRSKALGYGKPLQKRVSSTEALSIKNSSVAGYLERVIEFIDISDEIYVETARTRNYIQSRDTILTIEM